MITTEDTQAHLLKIAKNLEEIQDTFIEFRKTFQEHIKNKESTTVGDIKNYYKWLSLVQEWLDKLAIMYLPPSVVSWDKSPEEWEEEFKNFLKAQAPSLFITETLLDDSPTLSTKEVH